MLIAQITVKFNSKYTIIFYPCQTQTFGSIFSQHFTNESSQQKFLSKVAILKFFFRKHFFRALLQLLKLTYNPKTSEIEFILIDNSKKFFNSTQNNQKPIKLSENVKKIIELVKNKDENIQVSIFNEFSYLKINTDPELVLEKFRKPYEKFEISKTNTIKKKIKQILINFKSKPKT